MAGLYSSVGRKKKNNALTVSIILGVVVVILFVFIIWATASFSGGEYKNTVTEVSEMKMLIEEKDAQINGLKEQIGRYEERIRQLESTIGSVQPVSVPTPQPTETPKADEE